MHLLAELVALLAPPACVGCRAALTDATAMLCVECRRQLPWLRDGCSRCGLPAHTAARCPAAGSGLARTWAPLAYEGVARELMHALKFRGHLPLAAAMAAQISANLPRELRAAGAAVVPVPAHAGRRRRRGHDPAALLARQVAARIGRPYAPCLRRTDRSRPQVGATRAHRLGARRLSVRVAGPVPERVLLVDDVHTTGATLGACAGVLRGAGARWVAGITYARAL